MFNVTKFFLLTLALTLVGCGGPSTEDLVVGKWLFSRELNHQETARMAGGAPPGVRMSASIDGTQLFNADSSYEFDYDMTMSVQSPLGKIDLAFKVKESGSWQVIGDQLVESNSQPEFEPANEFTEALLRQDPSMMTELAAAPPEQVTATILEVSEFVMRIRDEQHQVELTLHRDMR